MAIVLKGAWTQQPTYRVAIDRDNPITVGLKALFDMNWMVEVVTGRKPSALGGTQVFNAGKRGRDFAGSGNVQWAHHPNFAITGPITIMAFLDLDAKTNYSAIISKQATTSTACPYELRLGTSPTDTLFNFGRATGAAIRQSQVSAGDKVAVGKNRVVGVRSPVGDISQVADFFSQGGFFSGALGGAGSGTPTDNGSSAVAVAARTGGSTFLDGRVYWVALWNRYLRDSEMLAVYRNPYLLYAQTQMPVGIPEEAAPSGFLPAWAVNANSYHSQGASHAA